MSTAVVSSRQRSARIATKPTSRHNGSADAANRLRRQHPSEMYPGLNDLSDFLEAFPLDVIRHFTLLREVEAKCTISSSLLSTMIPQFLAMPLEDPGRTQQLHDVRNIIAELLPCFEEKIHVAGNLSEAVARHMDRLDADFERISKGGELPDSVIYGPANHPALLGDGSKGEEGRAQTQTSTRSESRREAIAAKRAAQLAEDQSEPAFAQPHAAAQNAQKKTGRAGTGAQANGSGKSSGHGIGEKHGFDVDSPVLNNELLPAPKRRKGGSEKKENGGMASVSSVSAASVLVAAGQDNGRAHSPARPGTPSGQQSRRGGRGMTSRNGRRPPVSSSAALPVSPNRDDPENEPVYCYCQQVSYGEMVACDGRDCKREWFHLPCVGLSAPPKGQWFCDECAAKLGRKPKGRN